MHTSSFFKLFPPPKFMVMKHAGLDISDDGIRCIEYASHLKSRSLGLYDKAAIPDGIIEGGDLKKEKEFREILSAFEGKNKLSYVKVSLPEEKAYLFQTDVTGNDTRSIEQNIEFKLEENVPLSGADAVFYFDLLPLSVTGGVARASVSVVPRSYIEHYIDILRTSGVYPLAFEIVPRAIARALIPAGTEATHMIIHIMRRKTGIYVVSGGIVCFTSTVTRLDQVGEGASNYPAALMKEINRVYSYWLSHTAVQSPIAGIILTGAAAPEYEVVLGNVIAGADVPVVVGNVWQNSLDLGAYVPPISKSDSNEYVVAAGLAMDI